MIVARADEQKHPKMSSTLETVLLAFLVIRLNDRCKNPKGFAYGSATWRQGHNSHEWGFAWVGPQSGWRNAVPAFGRYCNIRVNGLMMPYFRTTTDSVNRLLPGDTVDFKRSLHLFWSKFRSEFRFSSILTIEIYAAAFFLAGILAGMSSSFHLHSESIVGKGETLPFWRRHDSMMCPFTFRFTWFCS